jgi:hypothetical protein
MILISIKDYIKIIYNIKRVNFNKKICNALKIKIIQKYHQL